MTHTNAKSENVKKYFELQIEMNRQMDSLGCARMELHLEMVNILDNMSEEELDENIAIWDALNLIDKTSNGIYCC